MTAPNLQVDGLAKRVGGAWLFRDVSFVLPAGRSMAVVGENGVGKTTLLDVVSGDARADEGHVFLSGLAVTRMPTWRRARLGLGRLYQDVGTFGSLSAREALQVPACRDARHLFSAVARGGGDGDVDWALECVGLSGARDARADQLSWGNQRLLAVARLIVSRPGLLVLDEPLAGLSPEGRNRMRGVVESLKAQGVGIVLVEHDLDAVDAVVDDLYRLENGRLATVR